MKRRRLLFATGALMAAPLLHAQTGRVARVGITIPQSVQLRADQRIE